MLVPEKMNEQESISAARAAFPRGLEQPGGALRFGLDALLLAAFAARHCEERRARLSQATAQTLRLSVAELGCGCGAALLALALRCPEVSGQGLEREESLLAAARRNAVALGLEQRLRFLHTDLAELRPESERKLAPDLVLANPPYGLPGRGRMSPSAMRERALRDADALRVFCRAAARLLPYRGHFFCIFEARSLSRLCAALGEARLGLRRIVPVRPNSHSPATRLLVEARKDAAAELRLEAPLTLHRKQSRQAARAVPFWTSRALAFCPWLTATT